MPFIAANGLLIHSENVLHVFRHFLIFKTGTAWAVTARGKENPVCAGIAGFL